MWLEQATSKTWNEAAKQLRAKGLNERVTITQSKRIKGEGPPIRSSAHINLWNMNSYYIPIGFTLQEHQNLSLCNPVSGYPSRTNSQTAYKLKPLGETCQFFPTRLPARRTRARFHPSSRHDISRRILHELLPSHVSRSSGALHRLL
jgi:hypothetical protein